MRRELNMAAKIWTAWEAAGRPEDDATLKKLLEGPVHLHARVPNGIAALKGLPLPEEPKAPGERLSGYKVDSFDNNLRGLLDYVTNDTWMAQFGGVNPAKLGTKGGYWAMSAKVREAAKAVGMKPAEAQETIWTFVKALKEGATAGKTIEETLHQLSEEDIHASPEFAHEIATNPKVRQFFADQAAKRGRSAPQPTATGDVTKAAGGRTSLAGKLLKEGKTSKRVLTNIADRLQKVEDAKKADTTPPSPPPGDGETPF